ncbi:hypothetical protein HD806DRAFT_552445 [Xylariaceae sp. AK1471]|nr:hypothetical protein HD806DRAFT_552445 [Xylariaceae sp. AK1471]
MLLRLPVLLTAACVVAAQNTGSSDSSVHVIPIPHASTSTTEPLPQITTSPVSKTTTTTTLTEGATDSAPPLTTTPISTTTTTSTQTECACPAITVTMIEPASSAASRRLAPSWARVLPLSVMVLFSYMTVVVMGSFAQAWIATTEDRVECGPAQGNAPSGPLPDKYLAEAGDCEVVADAARDDRGYWRTYGWNDNEANEYAYLDEEETCHFTIRHLNTKSTNDVRVGNADVEDYTRIALKQTTNDNKVAQGGIISCHNAKDPNSNELLEWRVWNGLKENSVSRSDRSAWTMVIMIITSILVSYWIYS